MFLDLEKGLSLDLAKDDVGLKSVDIGVNWAKMQSKFLGFSMGKKSVDLDLSALLFDKNGLHINTVYFGHLKSQGIRHSGDDLVGDDKNDELDNEIISIELNALNPLVCSIAIVLVSFRGEPFENVPYAEIKIYDKSTGKREPFLKTNVKAEDKFKGKVSLIFGLLSKKDTLWSYTNISEPTDKRTLKELPSVIQKYL